LNRGRSETTRASAFLLCQNCVRLLLVTVGWIVDWLAGAPSLMSEPHEGAPRPRQLRKSFQTAGLEKNQHILRRPLCVRPNVGFTEGSEAM
jgi:hypothetical protein